MHSIFQVGKSNVLQYSPNYDKWLVISNSGCSLMYAAVCSHDGYLYVIGGIEDKKYLKSVMKFHISTSTWSIIANMNIPRMSAGKLIRVKIWVPIFFEFLTVTPGAWYIILL